MKIGVAMIVKNEEVMLRRCLDTVKDFDEICILDTGSEDNTIKVAEKFAREANLVHADKVKIYTDYQWEDDFAKARNKILERCKADWIVSIDADERLLTDPQDVMAEIEAAANEGFGAIEIQLISDDGKCKLNFPRIFERAGARWKYPVHNILIPKKKSTRIDDIVIEFSRSPAHDKDPDRTFRILKKAVTDDPSNPRLMFYLARECGYKKAYTEALYFWDKYQSLGDQKMKADAYVYEALIHYQLGDYVKAIDRCLEAIKLNPEFREAYQLIADSKLKQNKMSEYHKWDRLAAEASNSHVLFERDRKKTPKGAEYYDKLYTDHTDFSRYNEVYKTIATIIDNEPNIYDLGCGIAEIRKFLPDNKNYVGYDFSEVAVKKARQKQYLANEGIEQADIYNHSFDGLKCDKDVVIATEVIEHLDRPIEIISKIPSGVRFIFSIPSFPDAAHIELYTFHKAVAAFIEEVVFVEWYFFAWDSANKKWIKSEKESRPMIYLFDSYKR